MSILTSIALGVVGIAVPGAGIAIAIARYGAKEVMGWAKDAASWLFLHPMAAVAIAAGLVIFIQGHKLGNRDDTIAGLKTAFAAEHKAFVTEKASFDAAETKIADNNLRIAAAGKELDREKQEAAANEARLNERWQSTQATVSALEADARDPKRKPCTVSDQAKRELDGL